MDAECMTFSAMASLAVFILHRVIVAPVETDGV